MDSRVEILIAEDSRTQREHLRLLLEENGFAVTAVTNGKEALAALQRHKPTLVVSDVVMPELNGYQLCSAIKTDPVLKDLPVILVTDLSGPYDVISGLDCGADNFVTKPYDEKHLLTRIRYILNNRALRGRDKVQMGVEIDVSGRRHFITAERQQILDLLISTYEEAVRLNEELRGQKRQLERSYRTLDGLFRIVDGLNRCYTEREVADRLLEGAIKLPGIRTGWIFLKNGERPSLVAGKGLSPVPALESGPCVCQQRLMAGTLDGPLAIADCEWLRRADLADGTMHGHRSLPLHAEGETIGVLNLVLDDDDDELGNGNAAMTATLGSQASAAFARARLHDELDKRVAERTAALRESEERLRAIAANVPGALFQRVQGNDGGLDYTYLSPRIAEVLGFDPASIGSEPLLLERLVTPELAGEFTAALRRAAATGEPQQVEGPVASEGEPRWLRVLLSARRAAEGGTLWDGLLLDITEERKLRLQSEALEKQLHHAQKMEAIGNLTGGLAHDFNNILQIVISNLDLLADEAHGQPDLQQLISSATGACLRGATLTSQLLAFARRQPLEPQLVDVNQLVEGMVKLLRRTVGESVQIATIPATGLWPTQVDSAQLESAIANLALNARDAMPRGGTLTFETRNVSLDVDYARMNPGVEAGDYVLIEASDMGTGMTPEVLGRIFEPFFTTKESRGTGLGLAMIFGFVRQSGGHIKAYSEAGHGTTMRLYLPRALDSNVASAGPAPADPAVPAGRRELILVVEDNEGVRQLVVTQLTGLGYEVVAVDTAKAALEHLDRPERVDLLFTDVVLASGMNGYELWQEAKTRRPNLRVLFTSGFSGAALGKSGTLATGGGLLSKPYRRADLARRVREALETDAA